MNVTETQMLDVLGRNVKVRLHSGKEIVGKCVGFTQASDNEPEIASIDVCQYENSYIELYQNEIIQLSVI